MSISSWLLAYLPAIALKAAAAEREQEQKKKEEINNFYSFKGFIYI